MWSPGTPITRLIRCLPEFFGNRCTYSRAVTAAPLTPLRCSFGSQLSGSSKTTTSPRFTSSRSQTLTMMRSPVIKVRSMEAEGIEKFCTIKVLISATTAMITTMTTTLLILRLINPCRGALSECRFGATVSDCGESITSRSKSVSELAKTLTFLKAHSGSLNLGLAKHPKDTALSLKTRQRLELVFQALPQERLSFRPHDARESWRPYHAAYVRSTAWRDVRHRG